MQWQEISHMTTLTVSLPDHLSEWVDERLKDGRYSTASDYVRELIRRDREQREALVGALIEGEQSGTSQRTVQEIAAAAKAKLSNGQI
jgi:antitoxin ParD1/3/4